MEFRTANEATWILAEASARHASADYLLSLTDLTPLQPRHAKTMQSGTQPLPTMEVLLEALDAISEGFVYFDSEDRLIVFNRKHRELFPSYAEALVHGIQFEELLRTQLRNIELSVAVGREETYIAERVAAHRDPGPPREQIWEDGRIIRLSEYRTRSGGIVSLRTDITDLKRAEAEVRRLNEDLEQRVEERTNELRLAQGELVRSERLATLGQLTATVNHELRNPLGTMQNALAVLGRLPIGDDARTRRSIAQLAKGLQRCRQIVDELLDFTQVRDVQLVPVSVDSWVDQIVRELASPAAVTLDFEPGAGDTAVQIDPHRLRRALVNVIENAIQSIDETWTGPQGGTVWISTNLSRHGLRLSVRDDGPGIAEKDLDRIFDPLFSTRLHGFGLGLPTVRQILEQHGGTVTVECGAQGGTTFCLHLPASLCTDNTG